MIWSFEVEGLAVALDRTRLAAGIAHESKQVIRLGGSPGFRASELRQNPGGLL